jgi:hypothetical protein
MSITEKIANWFRPKKKTTVYTPPVRATRPSTYQVRPAPTRPVQRVTQNVKITRTNSPYYGYSYINGYWYDSYNQLVAQSLVNDLIYLLDDPYYYTVDTTFYDPTVYTVAPDWVDAGPSYVDSSSVVVDSSPSYVDTTPSYVDTTPSYVDSSSQDVSQVDYSPQVDTTPSYVDTTPSYVDTTP